MAKVALVLVGVLIGFLLLGYLFIEFIEWNKEEPESQRKWSDPNHRDE
jgi:hypothetical protein